MGVPPMVRVHTHIERSSIQPAAPAALAPSPARTGFSIAGSDL